MEEIFVWRNLILLFHWDNLAVSWCGIVWDSNLASYFTELEIGDQILFISSNLSFEQIFDHSFCVRVPGLWLCYRNVCVYSTLLAEKQEFGRAFNLTFGSQMLKSSSTSETKSVSCLLLD